MKILLATWNPDKILWLSEGFAGLGLDVEAVDPAAGSAEEDGDTCAENAEKKAMAVGFVRGAIVVAEDSGLFLDGLDGFPGTHTARWAAGSDYDRAKILIQKLQGNESRGARFVSAVCLLFPDGKRAVCEGVLEGRAAAALRGAQEDGYDALFEMPDGRTIAETGADIVDGYSHRRRAMEAARREIRKWMGQKN